MQIAGRGTTRLLCKLSWGLETSKAAKQTLRALNTNRLAASQSVVRGKSWHTARSPVPLHTEIEFLAIMLPDFKCSGAGVSYKSDSRTAVRGITMTVADSQVSCSYIMGIESSCDDTAVAVLRTSDGAILGHSIAGQVALSDKQESLMCWSFQAMTYNLNMGLFYLAYCSQPCLWQESEIEDEQVKTRARIARVFQC